MNEMIERVKAAIENPPVRFFSRRRIDKRCYQVIKDIDPDGPISDKTQEVVYEGTYSECEIMAIDLQETAVARAAIMAMREPTDAMVDAVWRAPDVQVYDPPNPGQEMDAFDFKAAWRAMIDEMLRE
jgi:hypothetical protein